MEQKMMTKRMQVQNISKTFFSNQEYFTAVEDVSFDVYDGEFLVLLGPGRCGKTIILNMIAGLLEPTDGKIFYEGNEWSGLNADISMVFQKTALMPFKTVMENVELGLKFSGMNKKERREISQHYIELVGLQGFEKSYPNQLSGGMKQRVGIARAYATNPKVLIMDEPFGALDAQTRYSMQEEILRIWEQEKRTVLFVTNNIEEACYLADRIVLLSQCPANVKEEYAINIPRPRDIVGTDFLALRTKISENTDLAI